MRLEKADVRTFASRDVGSRESAVGNTFASITDLSVLLP